MSRRFLQSLLLPVILLPAACTPRPLTEGVYVWQRDWQPEVGEALAGIPEIEPLVLWRELRIHGGRAEKTPIASDLAMLASRRKHAGFVLRIPEADGGLGADAADVMLDEIAEVHRQAATAGIEVSEIQIDYDCPTRLLDGYAEFLRLLKRRLPAVRLTPTALPAWLDSPDWPLVARAADGFVLQLHSLALPKPDAGTVPLFDADNAADDVAKAARSGVHFRIALPTYESLAVFDADGRLLDVVSEGDAPPAASIVRGVSDPGSIARFVAGLQTSRPRSLTGLLWYRLPVASDRRNWPAKTWRMVRAGKIPAVAVRMERRPLPNGAERVVLISTGDAPAEFPARLVVSESALEVIAADALPPYVARRDGSALVFELGRTPDHALLPGDAQTIGWIRSRP